MMRREGDVRARVHWLQTAGERLPFVDGAFDRVICTETLEHVDDDGVLARELVRVLKPGGILAVSVPDEFSEKPSKSSSTKSITSNKQARRVYLDLLDAGFEVHEHDCKTHDCFARAIGVLEPDGTKSTSLGQELASDDTSGGVAESGEEKPVSARPIPTAAPRRMASDSGPGTSKKSHLPSTCGFQNGSFPTVSSDGFTTSTQSAPSLGSLCRRCRPRSSRRELAEYYLSINQCLQDYRRELELNPAEFAAFLYDFSARYVDVADADQFDPPERVWLLPGHPEGDYEWLEAADDNSKSMWQGSDGIRPGDLCVMWVRSPHSCTHSVWRAISRGYNDPFFPYYRTVWIGHPLRVPRIKFKELAANATWATNPSIRAHFQGASGREITGPEYEALLEYVERTRS